MWMWQSSAGSGTISRAEPRTSTSWARKRGTPGPTVEPPAAGPPIPSTARSTTQPAARCVPWPSPEGGQPVLGVVDLPFLGARYWATNGGGAFRNGEVIRVAGRAKLDQAIVALGDFAVGPGADRLNGLQLRMAALFAGRALRVRMLGSSAIDLAWLADGKHHASVTLSNRPWDMAAGVVI